MKIKFTKASKKDKYLVTVNLHELDSNGVIISCPIAGTNIQSSDLSRGDAFVLYVDNEPTVFRVNREGRTATTKNFPRYLRGPSVGKPVSADVGKGGMFLYE